MDLEYIGKIVNTHGLKGEVRIISNFKFKNDVFKLGNKVYINNNIYIIKSYRKHKIYDMIVFDKITDIEDALKIKGYNVYINKEDYKFNGYLDSDLLNLDVYSDEIYKGKIVDIYKTNTNDLLVIEGIKRHMVPNTDIFVKKVDLNAKKIYINYIKGLDNED